MPAAFYVTVTPVTLNVAGSAAHAAEIRKHAPLTEEPGLGVDMCSHNLRNLWQLVEEAVSLTMHISYPSAVCKLTQTKIDTAEIYCISIAVSRLYKIRHYWSMNCLRGP